MTTPVYIQIKQHIEQKIRSGEWPTGHKIATELELTKQFGVSRMTVNKAIRDLVNEGRLERTPRRGTFVRKPPGKAQSPLLTTTNIAHEVTERGQQYRCQVLEQSSLTADELIATKLGIMLGSLVFVTRIVHFADDVPLQLEVRWVNAALAPHYLEQDFTKVTPHQYLSECSPLTALEHTVEALLPDSEIKQLLEIRDNEACLLLNRRTWCHQDLVSFARLWHPGSKYKLSSKIDL